MPKVIVGMSGGVDSAVAAYLLKMAGYEVVGVTLRTWLTADGADSRCCEIDDANRVAQQLDIPYYVISCLTEFNEQVVRPFTEEYIKGRTPNPCVGCNRCIKWEKMLEAADSMGADYIATGHYASVVRLANGRYTVKTASHSAKDQTYMLYQLSQEQLRRTLMPLGNLSKEEVRAVAKGAGLAVADKPDSQEICFVTEGSYGEFIETHAEGPVPGPGNFVDEAGNVLGQHKGIIHYTIGQRKGLGIALGEPVYVKAIDPAANEVVLSGEEALFARKIRIDAPYFMAIPALTEELSCLAKIRYHHPAQPAVIEPAEDGGLLLSFAQPVRAATPGQSAVFYDTAGCVIGGGVISIDKASGKVLY